MINRFYFMRTQTELDTGKRMHNCVVRKHKSFLREDMAAFDAMHDDIFKRWEGYNSPVVHVTEFKKL